MNKTENILEEPLKQETRVCRTCNYEVTNPFTEKCPRCLTAVPKIEVYCESCISSKQCHYTRKVENEI
jgi:rubrerythrin